MDYSDRQITTAFELLGISRRELMRARANPGILEALKVRAKRNWRATAKELHPDHTQDDPQLTEMFKLVKHVLDEITDMHVQTSPRRVKWALRMVQVEAT